MGNNSVMVFVEELQNGVINFATWVIGIVDEDSFFYGKKLSVSDLHEDGQLVRIKLSDMTTGVKEKYLGGEKYTTHYIETENPKTDTRIKVLAESAVKKDILIGVTREHLRYSALEGLWAERL